MQIDIKTLGFFLKRQVSLFPLSEVDQIVLLKDVFKPQFQQLSDFLLRSCEVDNVKVSPSEFVCFACSHSCFFEQQKEC